MLVYTITKGNNKSYVYDIYHGIQGPQGIQGIQGEQGIQGVPGTAATISVGSVTSGSTPSVTNVGTSNAAIFDFVLEKGDKGDQGPVGQAAGFGTPTASASTLTPGASATASVTATGDATQKVFDFSFGIPAGQNAGFGTPTASATSLSAGSTPTIAVTASGQDTAKVFDFAFGIPKGDKGDTGSTGPTGPGVPSGGVSNQILLKSSSTDYDTQWKDVWEVKATELNSANFKLNLFKNGTEFTDAAYILYTVEKDRNAGSSFTRQRAISYDSNYHCYYIQLDNGEWLPNGFFRVTVNVYSDSTKTTLLGSDLIDYFDTATSIASGINGFTTGDQVYTALQNAGSWNIEVNYFTSSTMVLKAFKNGTAYSGTIFAYLTYGDGTTSQRTPNPMMLTASSGTITITSNEFSDIATVLADLTKTNFYFEFQETFTGSIFYTLNYVRSGGAGFNPSSMTEITYPSVLSNSASLSSRISVEQTERVAADATKIDKVSSPTAGDIAVLTSGGEVADSSKSFSDLMPSVSNLPALTDYSFIVGDYVSSAPVSASAAGFKGQMFIATDYLYICVADNTWKRCALSTF